MNTRVLVVDDNQAHASGLAELLRIAGFDAREIDNGHDALRIAAEGSVDAVLLDLGLPDMSGYEVCRQLRSDERTAHIAVIFHSGTQEPLHFDHHGDAFLTFPISFSEVFSTIRGCVARRRNKRAKASAPSAASNDIAPSCRPKSA